MRLLPSSGLLIALAGGFILIPEPQPAQAQDCSETAACVPEFPSPTEPPAVSKTDVVITLDLIDERSPLLVGTAAAQQDTARVVTRISDAFGFCAAIQAREYVVDCVSQQLESVAESLPRRATTLRSGPCWRIPRGA